MQSDTDTNNTDGAALLPVTPEDRQAAVEFLEALGFPQHAPMVAGGSVFTDEQGERAVAVLARHRISHPLPGDVGMREALELARSIIGNMIRHGFAYIVEADEKMPIPQPNAFYIGPGVLPKIDAALTPSALSGDAP